MTPATSFSRTLSARAAPSGMKPSSPTACSTRSLASGRGLRPGSGYRPRVTPASIHPLPNC